MDNHRNSIALYPRAFFFLLLSSLLNCCSDPEDIVSDPLPEACFSAPLMAIVDEVISFDASCSKNADNFHWDFGDAQESTQAIAQHSFAAPGSYTVTLTVENKGKSTTLSQDVTVSPFVDEMVPIFSVFVDEDYSGIQKEDLWILIHAPGGELLDFKHVTEPGEITFETKMSMKPERVGVTIFTVDELPWIKVYWFSANLSIPVGQEWVLKTNRGVASPILPVIGNVAINYELPSGLKMDYIGSNTSQLKDNIKYCTLPILEGSSKTFLLSVADEEHSRYKLMENVAVGDRYDILFSEMDEFDNVVDFSFPQTLNPHAIVMTMDPGETFYTYNNTLNIPPFAPSTAGTSFRLGYLDRFETYETSFQLKYESFDFEYLKQGSPPDPFSIPDHSPFTLADNSMTNFSYTAEQEFTKRYSHYEDPESPANSSVYWTISAPPDNSDKVDELPSELTDMYPFISPDRPKHLYTKFETSTKSYYGQIDTNFRGAPVAEEFETTFIRVE